MCVCCQTTSSHTRTLTHTHLHSQRERETYMQTGTHTIKASLWTGLPQMIKFYLLLRANIGFLWGSGRQRQRRHQRQWQRQRRQQHSTIIKRTLNEDHVAATSSGGKVASGKWGWWRCRESRSSVSCHRKANIKPSQPSHPLGMGQEGYEQRMLCKNYILGEEKTSLSNRI